MRSRVAWYPYVAGQFLYLCGIGGYSLEANTKVVYKYCRRISFFFLRMLVTIQEL